MNDEGLLVVISAPSGGGKTTICHALMDIDGYDFSISCTTRPPRAMERDGIDYNFVSESVFKEYIDKNLLAEWQKIFGFYYGTLNSTLEEAIYKKRILLLDVDVKGGLNVKKLFIDNTLTIFLVPPDIETLVNRLSNRGTEDEEAISIRRKRIEEEMELGEYFDHKVVNNRLDETIERVNFIIKERMSKWL